MKRVVTSIIICILFGMPLHLIPDAYANGEIDEIEEEEVSDEVIDENDGSNLFNPETYVGTQSVLTGKIPVYVFVSPEIDCEKTQIVWHLPRGLKTDQQKEVWFNMKEGEGRTFVLEVVPVIPGEYDIDIELVAWRYDGNYVDSSEVKITVDENLVASPQSSEYKRNKVLLVIGEIVVVLIGIVVVFFASKFFFKKFTQWRKEIM